MITDRNESAHLILVASLYIAKKNLDIKQPSTYGRSSQAMCSQSQPYNFEGAQGIALYDLLHLEHPYAR